MTIPLIVVLGVLGTLLGSFGCAQVWRLRARQLMEDKDEYQQKKAAGEAVVKEDYYTSSELTKLKGLIRPATQDRSECLHCHHTLAWYDLLPVVSWMALQGKCRYCRQPIGSTELFAEIGLGIVFIVSYLAWPHTLSTVFDVAVFSMWLIACVLMLILFIYDTKWSLLPFMINVALIVVAAICMILSGVAYGFDIWSTTLSVALLAGLYAVFATFRWAGFGDSILGVGLALLLVDWKLAFVALFLANIFGCLMLLPLYIKKQLHRRLRVPFGPFMILGAFVAMLWGTQLIEWFSLLTSQYLISLMV